MVAALKSTPIKATPKLSLLKNVPAWFLRAYYALEAKGEYKEPITVLSPFTLGVIREDMANQCTLHDPSDKPEYTAYVIGEVYQQFGPHKAGEAWEYLVELEKTALARERKREKAQLERSNKTWQARMETVSMRSLRHWFVQNWEVINHDGLYQGLSEVGTDGYPVMMLANMLIGHLFIEQPDALFTLSIRQAWKTVEPMAQNAIKLYRLNQQFGKI